MANSTFTFAQVTRGSTGVEDALNKFFASPIGGVIDSVLDLVALGVVGFGVWMILKAVKSPNPGAEMAKKALWPFVAAALLLKLDWTVGLIGLITKAITTVIESVGVLIPGLG